MSKASGKSNGVPTQSGADGDLLLPTMIAQSWLRSESAGLTPDGGGMRSIFVEDLDLQRRMVQCAMPVLDELQDDLNGMPLGIALTDERAQVMLRRDVDRSLANHFEAVSFSPGFDYSEEIVGTNGVGTALATGSAVYVHAEQHFKASIRHFTCAGAPIHNPLTGRLEGLVDISSLAKNANPLMRQLAIRAARDIQENLKATGSAKQQLMLKAFLSVSRKSRAAVFSLGCGVFMSNDIGSKLLDPCDESFLREEANSMLAPMSHERTKLLLPSGLEATVRRTLVEDGIEAVGVILQVEPLRVSSHRTSQRQRTPSFPGVVGKSGSWQQCCTEISRLAAAKTNALLVGEAGCGRAALARGAHLQKNPLAPFATVDCAAESLHDDLRSALDSAATTVALIGIDALSDAEDAAVAEIVDADQRDYPARWIVATAQARSDRLAISRLAAHLKSSVEVPPLRHHPDDIADIARFHLSRLAPSRTVEVNDDAMRILRTYQWPGNVTELVDVLRHALRVRPVGTIGPLDLPAALQSTPRRYLTAMEASERDTIVTALRASGGNRLRTSTTLGISRSSLYRKIAVYGIHA
ncbi:sigma-54-dependent Fis family transcriptional regulator [Rhodococcus qingshengii]|uniref:sigma-54-dependent Fis family transcriptional regulator n=1 Tax=Rhodococcus qingshengii TaxID=334542 RepID=UPI0030165B3F